MDTLLDTLVFGPIAVNNLNKEQEPFVPEPAEFQPFDVRALECFNARDNSVSRSFDRKQSYVAKLYPDLYDYEPRR